MSSDLTALVDLGSSSVRFMLVRIEAGVGYRVLADTRVRTRLGSGPAGVLPDDAIDATLVAVRRFLEGQRRDPPLRVLTVATAAVREAANARDLLQPLRAGLGLEVEVLTAAEEGRLGALAARASLQLHEATVVDLGGCSLQVSEIRDGQPAALGSVPLGAIRLTRDFLRGDPPGAGELDALGRAVAAATLDVLPPATAEEPLVAVGGTARALAGFGGREPRRGAVQRLRLSPGELQAIRRRLASLPLAERRQFPGLKPGRADVIVAGAVALETLMRMGGDAGLLVAEHGVRHGVLLRETYERVRLAWSSPATRTRRAEYLVVREVDARLGARGGSALLAILRRLGARRRVGVLARAIPSCPPRSPRSSPVTLDLPDRRSAAPITSAVRAW